VTMMLELLLDNVHVIGHISGASLRVVVMVTTATFRIRKIDVNQP
jgi:mRNA-degrading endonuclease HigB of HigAB toxin-antitoxin module